MTNKKDKILNAALKLFAKDGFAATSTNKVARKACVSEGLIFRHFKNKEGLLHEILNEGEDRIKQIFADIIFETDPIKVIHKTINISTQIVESKADYDFWKLQYKIKWEIEHYNSQKMEPLEIALTNAFKKLNYENPEMEAKMLLINIDGLATRYFLQDNFEIEPIIQHLEEKYKS